VYNDDGNEMRTHRRAQSPGRDRDPELEAAESDCGRDRSPAPDSDWRPAQSPRSPEAQRPNPVPLPEREAEESEPAAHSYGRCRRDLRLPRSVRGPISGEPQRTSLP
jgi:hypothetical protein